MEVATWTLIGMFGAMLGVLSVALFRLDSKIEGLGTRLDSRIDGLGARIDAQGGRIDRLTEQIARLTAALTGSVGGS